MKLCLALLSLCSLSTAALAQNDGPLPQAILDLPLKPTVINTSPGPEYSDEQRDYAMIIGADRTPKGRIWAAWVSGGDSARAYFVAASSDDEGKTWSKPRLVIDPPDAPTGLEVSALVGNFWTDPTGRLWLFYDQSLAMFDGRAGLWAITCDNPDDDKPVWSEPRRIWHGMTLNKPTVLSNGEWMLPISLWSRDKIGVPELKDKGYSDLDEVRMANVFVSADKGATWTRRGGVLFPETNFDEHMVVELKDKRLWMLARTKSGVSESFSTDQGRTWTQPKLSQIKNLSARFFIRRLASGNIVLIKNGLINETLKSRSHMTAFLSDDEGATWKGGLLLDERNGVSYPDGFQSPDGVVTIVHDHGRGSDREIIMHRITEADILAKKLVTPASKTKMLVSKATGPKITGRLYNGIELPPEWPPKNGNPESYEPMEVPYLKNKPKVIPIQDKRQLFVDDFLIEKTDLIRTWHQAKKHEKNPVLKPETKYELEPSKDGGQQQAVCYLGHGGVFHDPKDDLYKMFYTASWRGGLALATSKDLLTWTRPDIGTVGGNLLLPPGPEWAGGDNSVWLDVNTRDRNQRLKMITDRRPLPITHSLHTSADGKVWSLGTPTSKAGDYCSFFHNPFRKVWCFSIKQSGPHGRSRWYSESEDFIKGADWSKSVYWCNADKLDEPDPKIGDPAELYSLNAVAYESLMLGEFYILLGPNNKICDKGDFPKTTEIKLGFSRDGFHWDRPDRSAFIAATRKEGDWDRAYIHGTTGVCLVKEDEIWFPYTGYSGIAPNGVRGMYTGASIGMAVLRRDGFASMEAGEKGGSLTTNTLGFNGRHLYVNADCPKGELRVEVLDETGQVIAPYTKENCLPISADKTRQQVQWKGAPTLDGARGKPVKFRFHLTQGSLYSFWTSTDEADVAAKAEATIPAPKKEQAKAQSPAQAPAAEAHYPTDSLKAAKVYTAPVPARYLDENRMFLCGPGITASPGGRLWATFKTGDIGEDEDNCTVVITSGDHGKTWSKPVLVVDIDGPVRTNDPGIWTDPNGKVTLMWGQVYGFWDGRGGLWSMTAEDGENENTKWSQPVRHCDGYTKNKPFVTRNGDWLYLIEHMGPQGSRRRYANGAPMDPQFIHPRPELNHANVFISKDQGATLRPLSKSVIPEKDKTYQEHMVVEKKDGSLWMLGRTRYGIGESFSQDQGRTWTEMAPAKGIAGPSSRTFFQRLKSGNLLLIKNGDRIDQPSKRTHMTAYLSEDDGATWPHQLLLDERETSYPDAAEDKDGFINIVHDFGRTSEKEVIFHRITEADIKAGKLVNPKSVAGHIANKATYEKLSAEAYDEWKSRLK